MSGRISGSCEEKEVQADLTIYSFPEGKYYCEDKYGRRMLDISKERIIEYYLTGEGDAVAPYGWQELKNGRAVDISDITVLSNRTETVNETVNREYLYKKMNPFLFINNGKEELFSILGTEELYFRDVMMKGYAYSFIKKNEGD